MTKFFKNKQQVKVTPKEPRSLEEIQKEYSELLGKAAEVQYIIFVQKRVLEETNKELVRVNQEGAARVELDKVQKTAIKEEAQ